MSVADLPPPVQAHLPLHAQEIYLGAFNNAWTQYAARGPARRESTAHRIEWVIGSKHRMRNEDGPSERRF